MTGAQGSAAHGKVQDHRIQSRVGGVVGTRGREKYKVQNPDRSQGRQVRNIFNQRRHIRRVSTLFLREGPGAALAKSKRTTSVSKIHDGLMGRHRVAKLAQETHGALSKDSDASHFQQTLKAGVQTSSQLEDTIRTGGVECICAERASPYKEKSGVKRRGAASICKGQE